MKQEILQKAIIEQLDKAQVLCNFYANNFDVANKMKGLTAPEINCEEYRKTSVKLSDIAQKGQLLVFRYAEINCSTCYEIAIKSIQTVFADDDSSVVLLCSYTNDKDLFTFKRMNKIHYPTYRIASEAFNWLAEEYNMPYFFVLEPDMTISDIFMPNRNFPEITRSYLESIKRNLMNYENP
jgi:peroxiredoxin